MTDNDFVKIMNELIKDVHNKRPWGLRFLAELVDNYFTPVDFIEDHVAEKVLTALAEYDLVDAKRNKPFLEFSNDQAILAFAQTNKASNDHSKGSMALFELIHLSALDNTVKRTQISVSIILGFHLYYLGVDNIKEQHLRDVMQAYRTYKIKAVAEDEMLVQYQFSDFIEAIVARNPIALLTLFMEFIGTHDIETSEMEAAITQALHKFKKLVAFDNAPVESFLKSIEISNLLYCGSQMADEENHDTILSLSQLLGLFDEVEDEYFQSQLDGLMDLLGSIDSYRQDNYGDISPMASILQNWETAEMSHFRLARRKPTEVPINH